MSIEKVLGDIESVLPDYSYTWKRGVGSFALLAENPRWVLAVVTPVDAAEVRRRVRAWERELVQRGGGGRGLALVLLVQKPLTGFDATSIGQLGRRVDPVRVVPMELAAVSLGVRAVYEAFDMFLAPPEGLASALTPPRRANAAAHS